MMVLPRWWRMHFQEVASGSAQCRTLASETRRAAVVHDMFLHVVESADRLILDWDYRSSLFDEATVGNWMTDLVNLIDTLALTQAGAEKERETERQTEREQARGAGSER